MRHFTRTMTAILAAGFVASAVLASEAPARSQSPSLREAIVGTWMAVAQYVDQNGTKLEPFGSAPRGMAVYDGNGRFMFILVRSGLPNFATNNRLSGTADENKAIVQGSIAYFGTYSVDEAQRTLKLHFEGSTYPNWDGQDQIRTIAIAGDELTVVSSAATVGTGTVHLVMRRAR